MEVSMHSFTTMTNHVRWLRRVTLAVAIIMIGWGASVVLGQPVTAWFTASATIWMALLLISALWQLRGSFTAIAALALATAVVSRLFSILRLNPPASIAGLTPQDLDLLVATGPGVPGFELLGWFLGALVFVQFILRAARESSLNDAALTFIRVYLGLMFVPHFGITRPVALLGSVYLLMSMLWGGHFQIGYVWALPEGGYEFGVFWAVMIAVFAVLGGGPLSVDNTIRQSDFQNRWPRLRAARLLFL